MPKAKRVEPDLWLIALDPERKLVADIRERFDGIPTHPFGLRIGKRGEHDVIVTLHGNLLCIEAATRQQAGTFVTAMGNGNLHAVVALLYQGSIGPEPTCLFCPNNEVEVVSGGLGIHTNGTSSFVITPTVTATLQAWRKVADGLDPTGMSIPVRATEDLPLATALGLITPAR